MEALEKSRNGFKAYDIRGIVPTEVDEEVSYRVGRAYADQYKAVSYTHLTLPTKA